MTPVPDPPKSACGSGSAVAVPGAVDQLNDRFELGARDAVTVKCSMFGSLTVLVSPSVADASLIDSVSGGGTSSLMTVMVAVVAANVALVGFDRVRLIVSSASIFVSPLTETEIVAVVWLGAKVTVPVAAPTL